MATSPARVATPAVVDTADAAAAGSGRLAVATVRMTTVLLSTEEKAIPQASGAVADKRANMACSVTSTQTQGRRVATAALLGGSIQLRRLWRGQSVDIEPGFGRSSARQRPCRRGGVRGSAEFRRTPLRTDG